MTDGCPAIDVSCFFHKSKEQINVSRRRKARYLMNGPFVSAANLGRLEGSQVGKEVSFVLKKKKCLTFCYEQGLTGFYNVRVKFVFIRVYYAELKLGMDLN